MGPVARHFRRQGFLADGLKSFLGVVGLVVLAASLLAVSSQTVRSKLAEVRSWRDQFREVLEVQGRRGEAPRNGP